MLQQQNVQLILLHSNTVILISIVRRAAWIQQIHVQLRTNIVLILQSQLTFIHVVLPVYQMQNVLGQPLRK